MLKKILLSSVAVFLTAYVLPGVVITDYITVVIVALLLGILSVTIKPLLTILTLPITILTFGLFSLVINAIIVLLVDYLVEGFAVENFVWAVLFAFVLSVFSSALNMLLD